MRYLITGCGQSGTTYTAALLTAAGLDCGHEAIFNRWTPGYGTCPDFTAAGPAGDSSFAAVPFLGRVPDDVTVVHLVRPPLDVIRSVVGRGQMDAPRHWPWVRYVDHYTGILRVPVGARRAAVYWLGWNELAEARADVRWSLGGIGVDDLADLASRAGLDFDSARAEHAVEVTPRDIGSGSRADVGMYHLGRFAGQVADVADRYGLPLEKEEILLNTTARHLEPEESPWP